MQKRLSENRIISPLQLSPMLLFVLQSLSGRIRTTTLNIDQRFASNINVNQLKGFSGSIALDSISLLSKLAAGRE